MGARCTLADRLVERRRRRAADPGGGLRLFASPLLARLIPVVLGSLLPEAPGILTSFQWAIVGLTLWTLYALSIFVLVQAAHFLVRDLSWRSLLDLAAIGLVSFAVFRFPSGTPSMARLLMPAAFLCLWCLCGLFSAWLSFKAGPPVARAHLRYSLSMIFSLLLGAGAMLAAYLAIYR